MTTQQNDIATANSNDPIDQVDKETQDASITKEELDLLDSAGDENNQDDLNEQQAQLDDTDEDGEALNEGTDLTGEDLDVPGADLDDDDEKIGEEDEENNSYSEADDDNV
ncbi:hypothetical protein BH11BAC5_BH11BAC5_06130 [soil metagenome]